MILETVREATAKDEALPVIEVEDVYAGSLVGMVVRDESGKLYRTAALGEGEK